MMAITDQVTSGIKEVIATLPPVTLTQNKTVPGEVKAAPVAPKATKITTAI